MTLIFKRVWLRLAWIVLATFMVIGCGASELETASLEVRVYDHREAISDFDELWLTISAVAIHPADQPRTSGWLELEPDLSKLDLTRYTEGEQAVILQTAVETGLYNAVRLSVDRATGSLKNGNQAEVEVKLDPVALDFWIRQNHPAIVGLDLVVLDLSDHPDQAYELQIRTGILIPDG
jgi:hypothetical protein